MRFEVSSVKRLQTLHLKLETDRPSGRLYEFPGDVTDGETPDPMPNSEAKPVQADGSA